MNKHTLWVSSLLVLGMSFSGHVLSQQEDKDKALENACMEQAKEMGISEDKLEDFMNECIDVSEAKTD